MGKYMDQHPMNPATEEQLRELLNAPEDEFGVTHQDILFSKKADKAWCVIDAPSEEAVRKHHENLGVACEWINEVRSTKD